jgi:tRNA-dihydrouridine synthase B
MDRFFQQPFQFGRLTVPNRVLLAPLAGVSDVPFRRVCQEHGAGLTYVEMLSGVAIHRKNKRTLDMCRRHPSEPLLGVQLTGPTPESVGQGTAFLSGLPFDTIDINMGCSVRKVLASGSGSAMLNEPERLSRTVAAARQATSLPLSVKTRLGVSRERISIADTAARVVAEGAQLFTIHGRTQDERYGTPADLDGIRMGVEAMRRVAGEAGVVVGNGDLFTWQAADAMRRETGCDAVMVSRGALGNPWVFREILQGETVHPTMQEWGDVVLRHLAYQREHYGETRLAAVMMRKHLLWYIKGFPCNKALGRDVGLVESLTEAEERIRRYVAEWPADLPRFEGAHRTDSRFGAHSKYDPQYDPKYDPKYDMDRQHDRAVAEEETAAESAGD